MEYRIANKAQFTLIGIKRAFSSDNSYKEIPKFWDEVMSKEQKPVVGMYGLCETSSGNQFDYYIADNYDPCQDIPAGCEIKVIPAGMWAIFPCRGQLPGALQSVNTFIWNEWLPSSKEYRLAGNYDIEMYTQNPNYSEIWIPVEKAEQ